MLLVPKAGLEPARISTVDFESTASTDFATSALKRYAENVVDYTCRTPPCKRQLARTSLSAEIFSMPPPRRLLNPPFCKATPFFMLYTFLFNTTLRETRCR